MSPSKLCLLFLTLAFTSCAREEAPKLVLLISSDTLRADRLGSYGSERGLTPALDELAAESVVFEKTYAPSSFTVPSVSTFLTGRYPTQNAIYTNEHVLHEDVTTLASEMGRRGYATGAVVSNWVLRRGTGLDQGFDVYNDEMTSREAIRANFRERIAPATTDDALALLDQLKARGDHVFLWVHYQDPHGPYTPPAELLGPQLEEERARGQGKTLPFGKDHRGLDGIPTYQKLGDEQDSSYYLAAYHAEIQYADQEIGRLLEGLRGRGLYDDAVIVFAADHGEGLGENDYWFAHGEYLSDPLVHVPFFIRRPGKAPERRGDVATLADLMPTLLPLCGVAPPPNLPGRNLFADGAASQESVVYLATLGSSTVPRFGVVKDGRKLVHTFNSDRQVQSEELFEIRGKERALQPNQEIGAMRNALIELNQRLSADFTPATQNMSREELEVLNKLGYGGDE